MPRRIHIKPNEVKTHEVLNFENKLSATPDYQERKMYYQDFCERWAFAEIAFAAPEERMELRKEFWDRKWAHFDEFERFAKDNKLWIASMESLA